MKNNLPNNITETPISEPLAPPVKPSQYECCGRGCRPCVFDYYQTALRQWEQLYGAEPQAPKK